MITIKNNLQTKIAKEIQKHALPEDFAQAVETYYLPLAAQINARAEQKKAIAPLLVGIQGTQGSGKSTCADFMRLLLESGFDKAVLVMSIDDFYLTRAERQELADSIHPLLSTRGVPGTHDISLLNKVLDNCIQFDGSNVKVPVFDKSIDDRKEPREWKTIDKQMDVIILEGWCVGVTPQAEDELVRPINELEEKEDADGHWRYFVNQNLIDDYAKLYARLDCLIALQAPSFECVYEWRLLQEEKLRKKLLDASDNKNSIGLQSPQELRRFILHYERLTRHALATMPKQADWLLRLQADHSYLGLEPKTLENP